MGDFLYMTEEFDWEPERKEKPVPVPANERLNEYFVLLETKMTDKITDLVEYVDEII